MANDFTLFSHRHSPLSTAIKMAKNSIFGMKEKTELNLFDLPENIRVTINVKCSRKIFESLLNRHQSISVAARALGLSKGDYLHRYLIKMRSGIPLKLLRKMSFETNITREEMQASVVEIKTLKSTKKIRNPILPIRLLTPAFGLVVGGVLGDGGIEKNRRRVSYFSSEPEQIAGFRQAVLETFGDVEFAYHRSIGNVPCVLFPKIIGEVLCQIGLEEGNKNYKHHQGIPKMFMENPKSAATISLIRRLFDDDGTVAHNHSNRGVELIAPTIFKEDEKVIEPKVLIDLKKVLEKLSIESRIRDYSPYKKPNSEITHDWELVINGKKNLQLFHEKIGFGLARKQVLVEKVINMYVDGLEFYPRFQAEQSYISAIKVMENKKHEITANSLAKECKRNNRHVREVLLGLMQKSIVRRELIANKYVYSLAR